MDNVDNFYYGNKPTDITDFQYNILNYNNLPKVNIEDDYNRSNNTLVNYKYDYNNINDVGNFPIDNKYMADNNYKFDENYNVNMNYTPDIEYRMDKPYQMDSKLFNKGYNIDNVYEVVNSTDSTHTGAHTAKSNEGIQQNYFVDNNEYDYMKYYPEIPYYSNYNNLYNNQPLIQPIIPNSNPLINISHNDNQPNISNINDINLQLPTNIIGIDNNHNNKIYYDNIKDRDKYSNSTIDNESIEDIDEKDGSNPPSNRSDPIYTAISGLKWKSKSKKWVVRWDNPITNRRVYKYFSGSRYGFMGAHKRAKFYLEFLNASVGKIQNTTPGNPFCRRTEGPPKGKTNKSLIRKYYRNTPNMYYYQPNNNNTNMMYNNNMNYTTNVDQFNNNTDRFNQNIEFNNKGENTGSSMENPWYINQSFNNF